MKRLISKILRSTCFDIQPPVLVDIGASGGLPRQWRALAPHSIGVAFDADTRDFDANAAGPNRWKKLHLFNRLVTAESTGAVPFHLTSSPHCSSTLLPDTEALRPWAFRGLFEVTRTITLPAMALSSALAEAGIAHVDWYKCDSQGTDLRLFQSLHMDLQSHVLAADFEPGIIDAYRGEDKLPQLMTYMDTLPFWVSAMTVKGSQRVGDLAYNELSFPSRLLPKAFYRTSPGWCEISYLNTCESTAMSERDILLAIVFALVQRQYGFALDLARRGDQRFERKLFREITGAVRRRLRLGYFMLVPVIARALARRLT
jgi:hypothetical protein